MANSTFSQNQPKQRPRRRASNISFLCNNQLTAWKKPCLRTFPELLRGPSKDQDEGHCPLASSILVALLTWGWRFSIANWSLWVSRTVKWSSKTTNNVRNSSHIFSSIIYLLNSGVTKRHMPRITFRVPKCLSHKTGKSVLEAQGHLGREAPFSTPNKVNIITAHFVAMAGRPRAAGPLGPALNPALSSRNFILYCFGCFTAFLTSCDLISQRSGNWQQLVLHVEGNFSSSFHIISWQSWCFSLGLFVYNILT